MASDIWLPSGQDVTVELTADGRLFLDERVRMVRQPLEKKKTGFEKENENDD